VRSFDSEDDNLPAVFYQNDQMFWDPDELEFMQLDDFTSEREYYKVNCIGYEKQDQDYFIVEEAVAKWPD
jgi:hypothetical protein